MADAEARLAARKQFGGVDRLRMRHREQRGLPVVETLVQDVRFALRVLMRDRGFALTAIRRARRRARREQHVLHAGLCAQVSRPADRASRTASCPSRPSTIAPQSRDFPPGVRGNARQTDELPGPGRLREWRRRPSAIGVARPIASTRPTSPPERSSCSASRHRWGGCRPPPTIGPAIQPSCCSAPKRGGIATTTIRRSSAAPFWSTALRPR